MCVAVTFFDAGSGKTFPVYFNSRPARLICLSEDMVPGSAIWGISSRSEYPDFFLPVTGWARQESIDNGKWEKYSPTPVIIPAVGYVERDRDMKLQSFELNKGESLCGLHIRKQDLDFVYVITVPAPRRFAHIHDRWVKVEPVYSQIPEIDLSCFFDLSGKKSPQTMSLFDDSI